MTHPSGQGRISLADLIAENAERDMQEFLDACTIPATVHLMSGVITNGLAGSSQQLLMEAR